MAAKPALFILNDLAMRINRQLAIEIGFEESVLFLQLEYLIRDKGEMRSGVYWIQKTLAEWHEVFPWWSQAKIARLLQHLTDRELVTVGNFNQTKFDRIQWYSLNHEGIKQLKSVKLCDDDFSISQNEKSISQNEKWKLTKREMETNEMRNPSLQNEKWKLTKREITIHEDLKEDLKEEEEGIHVSHSLDVPVVHPEVLESKLSSRDEEIIEIFDYWKKIFNKRVNCKIIRGDNSFCQKKTG